MRNLFLFRLASGAARAAMPGMAAASPITGVVSDPAGRPPPLTQAKPAHRFRVSIGAKVAVLIWLVVGMAPAMCRAQNAYIANSATQSISVIDTLTNKVTATISNVSTPREIVVSPVGSVFYVGGVDAGGGGIISVYSTTTNKMLAQNTFGFVPTDMAITPDGKWIYFTSVLSSGQDVVGLIDTSNLSLYSQTQFSTNVPPYPGGVAVTPDRSTVYASFIVPHYAGALFGIDVAAGSMTELGPEGSAAQGMKISPDGGRLYTAGPGYGSSPAGSDGSVSVMDTASNASLGTIAGINECAFCYGSLALSPDGGTLYAATTLTNDPGLPLSGYLYVINTTTLAITATITLPFDPKGLGITPDGRTLYIANYYGDSIAVFDTVTRTLRRWQIAVGGWPTGLGSFIIHPSFAGTPGNPGCRGQSLAGLVAQFGSFDAAAADLGFYSPTALRRSLRAFCGGSDLAGDEEGR